MGKLGSNLICKGEVLTKRDLSPNIGLVKKDAQGGGGQDRRDDRGGRRRPGGGSFRGIVPEEVMTAGDQIAEEIEAHDPDPNNQK